MIKNYLTTAWRQLAKNQLFSVINIFGLSTGLMSCILILLFVSDEWSYDQWLTDGDRVVRMHTAYNNSESPPFLTVRSAGRMMQAIRDYAPKQVETGVRLLQSGFTVIKDDKAFNEDVVLADGTFFDVFKLPFVVGSAESSFNKPMDLVISEAMAMKYFGRTDVMGERLTFCCLQAERLDVQITGVIEDLPDNTHLDIDFLSYLEPSMFDFAPNVLNTWTSVNTYTYFKLHPGVEPQDLMERIDHWLDNESPLRDRVPEGMLPTDMMTMNVMKVPDLHLHASRDAGNMGDFKALGDIRMVYAFSGIAVLVLLIASINFMNLSTARASKRAREVALRKVMGASRGQVALQFLGEAVAIAVVSLLFALVAVEAVLPFYNQAIGRELTLFITEEPLLLSGLLLVAIIVGLVSGSYPAVYLSRFLPARIMKANQSSEASGQGHIRNLLVVFQFTVSIGLAICTIIIFWQTLFARSMDVGYSYDQKLVLSGLGSAEVSEQQKALVNELERIPSVSSVVLSSEVPSQDNENNTGFKLLDSGSESGIADELVLNYYTAGYGFFEAYNMQLLAGRAFDEQFGSDLVESIPEDEERIGNASIIINESAMSRLGFSEASDAIGRTLRANVFRAGTHDLTIIGVARDVHFRSIKFGIRPSVFFNNPNALRMATVSFNGDVESVTAAVEQVWKKFAPTTPIRHEILADMIHMQYQTEERQAQLLAVFALLAVVIACLGLFGLASFTAERRTREIGIRKVMGARIRDIISLLVWQFSIPVLVANVIAWPLVWFLMNNWLEGFTYRIDSGYILLASLGAGVGAMVIAWSTVAARAIKVASANPIASLRYE